MQVEFSASSDQWTVTLVATKAVPLDGIASIRAWPVSLRDAAAAVDASAIAEGESVTWPPASIHSLTGFIAFELTAAASAQSTRFVLSLPVSGLPVAERNAAIIRSVLANREGFLRYLLLLLGDEDSFEGLPPSTNRGSSISAFGTWGVSVPLLEEMTRALHRDVARLNAIKRLMRQLASRAQEDDDIVPREFLDLWVVFEEVLAEV